MKVNPHHLLFFQLLKSAKPSERKVLLAGAEHAIIKIIAETIHNLLLGNIPVDDATTRRLQAYKQTLYILANRTVTLHQKRGLLQQRADGSFFFLLLPILSTTFEHPT